MNLRSPTTISVAEYRALAKRRSSKCRDNGDKSGLFLDAIRLSGGCPEAWQREYRFAPPRRWRFDFALVGFALAVEVDGGRWLPGGGRHGSDADRTKLNEAAAMGWRVLRFSPKQLKDDPLGCADVVRRALR